MLVSGYRCMWALVMFDLPTDTKLARKHYTVFRKRLLDNGFSMLQFSVYARHCASKENLEVHVRRIKRHLPPDGEVRIMPVTDRQFERMEIFWGKTRKIPTPAPPQLQLF